MKKFKKHDQDVSCLYYWGEKNTIISSSWDTMVWLHDDSTPDAEGRMRYEMTKHTKSVNFIHFKPSHSLCASCSDDGQVIIYNYGSYRQEGILSRNTADGSDRAEVKVCKFLNPHNLIVTADLDGLLNFYNVYPSPNWNTLLCSVKDDIESETGKPENFPVWSLDYDDDEKMIYTGDEMGNLHKWNIWKLIEKQDEIDSKFDHSMGYDLNPKPSQKAFLTEANVGEERKETQLVTKELFKSKAHLDGCNHVTFIKELELIATCSFDCHVYIWNRQL